MTITLKQSANVTENYELLKLVKQKQNIWKQEICHLGKYTCRYVTFHVAPGMANYIIN